MLINNTVIFAASILGSGHSVRTEPSSGETLTSAGFFVTLHIFLKSPKVTENLPKNLRGSGLQGIGF